MPLNLEITWSSLAAAPLSTLTSAWRRIKKKKIPSSSLYSSGYDHHRVKLPCMELGHTSTSAASDFHNRWMWNQIEDSMYWPESPRRSLPWTYLSKLWPYHVIYALVYIWITSDSNNYSFLYCYMADGIKLRQCVALGARTIDQEIYSGRDC